VSPRAQLVMNWLQRQVDCDSTTIRPRYDPPPPPPRDGLEPERPGTSVPEKIFGDRDGVTVKIWKIFDYFVLRFTLVCGCLP